MRNHPQRTAAGAIHTKADRAVVGEKRKVAKQKEQLVTDIGQGKLRVSMRGHCPVNRQPKDCPLGPAGAAPPGG